MTPHLNTSHTIQTICNTLTYDGSPIGFVALRTDRVPEELRSLQHLSYEKGLPTLRVAECDRHSKGTRYGVGGNPIHESATDVHTSRILRFWNVSHRTIQRHAVHFGRTTSVYGAQGHSRRVGDPSQSVQLQASERFEHHLPNDQRWEAISVLRVHFGPNND